MAALALVTTEMIARVAKDLLRDRLRKVQSPDDATFSNIVVEFFNNLFGVSEESLAFYRSTVRVALLLKFGWYDPKFLPAVEMCVSSVNVWMY